MVDRRSKGAKPEPKPKSPARVAQARDRVFVHDLVLDVEIGVYTHEKGVTQRVRFSVDVDVLPATIALDDNIARAFDYDTIIKGIKDIIAARPYQSRRDAGRGSPSIASLIPAPPPSSSNREARQGARRARRRDRAR